MIPEILILISCVLFIAFFSGTETALLGLTPLNIARGNEKKLSKLYFLRERLIAVCLIGNNLMIVGATLTLGYLLPHESSLSTKILAFLTELVAIFLIGEVLPKSVFKRKDIKALQIFYYPLMTFHYAFYAFSGFFLYLTSVMRKFMPVRRDLAREEVFYFVGSQIEEDRTSITEGFLLLSKTKAKEVMTPIPDVFMLRDDIIVKDIAEMFENTSYSRYPVYTGRGDNITGFVDVFDLLNAPSNAKISQYQKPALFIPDTLPADKLLRRMQTEKISMAFIVNEYGGVVGLVTLENLAEELVGDILSQEQRQESIYIQPVGQKTWRLDGLVDIDDFNQYFSLSLRKDGFETLTGFIIHYLGRIPQINERIVFDFGVLSVEEADNKTVHKLIFQRRRKRKRG